MVHYSEPYLANKKGNQHFPGYLFSFLYNYIGYFQLTEQLFSPPPHEQSVLSPVCGLTLLHDFLNEAPSIKNILIAIPANEIPTRRMATTINLSM
jgi:hypothetical protein